MGENIQYGASANTRIAIVGLGYVGLPLAIAFSEHFSVVGYDKDSQRVLDLNLRIDRDGEFKPEDFPANGNLKFVDEQKQLINANVFIVSVPTPVDKWNSPQLGHLTDASKTIGHNLKRGDTVIFESTVFPGCTEEHCVPLLEATSGLRFNIDFFCGYSPERINPGDPNRRLKDIVKVTSGSTRQVAQFVDQLYKTVIEVGTHLAPSIRVAEAAKVIENTQRDLNIALMNELAKIFDALSINTQDVLDAASTKWNFLPFQPGLVGGHCVGVDPYYLTSKAQETGYHPEIILAGRRINESMGAFIAEKLMKRLLKSSDMQSPIKVLILGMAFKENCADCRNSKTVQIKKSLEAFGCVVDVFDPLVCKDRCKIEFDIDLINEPKEGQYDSVVLAVIHDEFLALGFEKLRGFGRKNAVFFDVKSAFKGCSEPYLSL